MSYKKSIDSIEASFRTKVKLYLKRAKEIEAYLDKYPNEWGKFQSEFNAEMNSLFRNIMNFERENMLVGDDNKIYKLKKFFINKIREFFVRGQYIEWSLRKPFGYAGDFKIINDIYDNNPKTTGFDRLFDNYFQMSAISVAVRNRKNDFKRMIKELVRENKQKTLRFMDLASGPCRDVKEMIFESENLFKKVKFDCYDNDKCAIEFGKDVLSRYKQVKFFKENAVRMALSKNIEKAVGKRYDLIYSTGLFDYFEKKIATKLISNLRKLLTFDGVMIIANVRDKYSNPSVYFMEWVGDWNLVYREGDEFLDIFKDAGFNRDQIDVQYEQQGIIEYIIAKQSNSKSSCDIMFS